jgi:predicted O-methyltransferase YrrM
MNSNLRFEFSKIESSNGIKKLNSAINPLEGKHLYDLVYNNNFKKTLEIGLANGLSALYLCQALYDLNKKEKKNRKHIAIDPYQKKQWNNAGIIQIKKAKLNNLFNHIESFSHLILPELITKGNKFDLIFIDGMHLFDYTLIDLFFADKLLDINGIIVLDDIKHPGVKKAFNFVLKNYVHWRLIKKTNVNDTSATFIKTDDDSRKWNFHKNF